MKLNRLKPASRFVTLNGLTFHYLDWGNDAKPVLLCLHGSTGQAHAWDFLGEAHLDDWHMVALDMRGHGQSQWAHGEYSIASFASDIEAFVDHLEVSSIHLIGLSLGGIVAMTYAGLFPLKVSNLILVDIAPAFSATALARLASSATAYPVEFESLDAAVEWALTDYLWAGKAALKNDLSLRLFQRDDQKWGWRVDLDLFSPSNRKRWSEEAPKRWAYFEQINCPILEVRGALSDLVSNDIVNRMMTVNTRTQCIDIDNAGHNVIADQPKVFSDTALSFLSQSLRNDAEHSPEHEPFR